MRKTVNGHKRKIAGLLTAGIFLFFAPVPRPAGKSSIFLGGPHLRAYFSGRAQLETDVGPPNFMANYAGALASLISPLR